MWETINAALFAIELILAVLLVITFFKKKQVWNSIVAGIIVGLNFCLYAVPLWYAREVGGSDQSLILGLWECISATIKQLVGEVRTELVGGYASVYPFFLYTYGFGAVLAVGASFSVANSVLGGRILNFFSMRRALRFETCDVVCGCSDTALNYVVASDNAVLLCDESVKKGVVSGLLDEDFVVLRKKFSRSLLVGKTLNAKTKYNFILFNDGNFLEYLDIIAQYVRSGCEEKRYRFYVEVDAAMNEAVQNKLNFLLGSVTDEARRAKYREAITLFSRDELIARRLMEEYPMTGYLPRSFICEDTSIRPDCRMQAIFLGMTPLSREIYKQFVINHQFAEWNGSEYVSKPLSYEIYDKTARVSEWEFGGVKQALERLDPADYFPLPETPCHTACHKENPELVDLSEIAQKLSADHCYSFVFVDVGDPNKNLELANRLKLLLGDVTDYHLFVRDNVTMADGEDDITEYGSLTEILNHDVIVDETLSALARRINREYCDLYGDLDGLTPQQADAKCEFKWYETHFFKRYSNVSLAINLRLKLNLLGLDYAENGAGDLIEEIARCVGDTKKAYTERNTYNALLAQEHFRWNAYYMMNGYLPMRKDAITVCASGEESPEKKKARIKETHQDQRTKRHACLTDWRGLQDLSEEIANRANEVCGREVEFTAEEFDFYQNDGMLLSVAPKFFEENGISVVKLA